MKVQVDRHGAGLRERDCILDLREGSATGFETQSAKAEVLEDRLCLGPVPAVDENIEIDHRADRETPVDRARQRRSLQHKGGDSGDGWDPNKDGVIEGVQHYARALASWSLIQATAPQLSSSATVPSRSAISASRPPHRSSRRAG